MKIIMLKREQTSERWGGCGGGGGGGVGFRGTAAAAKSHYNFCLLGASF